MRKRYIDIYIYICIVFLFVAVSNIYSEEAKVITLDSLINEALQNNPQLRVAYNEYLAARYKVKDISSFPDPMGKYTYLGQSIETRVGPQEHKYGISQKIPFPLKLYYRGKSALKRADMLKERYEAAKSKLIKDIKFIYYDIFWLDKALMILNEEVAILGNLEKIARVRFETGKTSQQDAIKADVEISKIQDKIFSIRQQRNTKVTMMNNLLNRSQNTPLGRVRDLDIQGFDYTLDELHNLASKNRQELLEASLNIERAKYEKSLSQLNFIPDFTFGFDYISVGSDSTIRTDDGKDAWMTTFAVNLPIWVDKLYAQIKEKDSLYKAAKENFTTVKNLVSYEIEDVYFKIITYRDILSLYKTALIPQTEQSFEAARAGYETGKVNFLDWLDAERTLLQTKLAYYKTITDYEKSIAYLERIVGVQFKDLEEKGEKE